MKIKRFDCKHRQYFEELYTTSDDGELVYYEDHIKVVDALKEEIESLKEQSMMWKEAFRKVDYDPYKEIIALEKEIRALKEQLKSRIPKVRSALIYLHVDNGRIENGDYVPLHRHVELVESLEEQIETQFWKDALKKKEGDHDPYKEIEALEHKIEIYEKANNELWESYLSLLLR